MTREEWNRARESYETRVKAIVIPPDPSPAIIKKIIADIDNVFADARLEYAQLKSRKDSLEKQIYAVEKKAAARGSNDSARRANGVEAVENFPVDEEGNTVNLWNVLEEIVERYEFMDGIIDILESKHNRLIIDSAVLKLEANISP